MIRKPIAIITVDAKLTALCDDGTIWKKDPALGWARLDLPPQPKFEATCVNCVWGAAGKHAGTFRCRRWPPGAYNVYPEVAAHNYCGEFVSSRPED